SSGGLAVELATADGAAAGSAHLAALEAAAGLAAGAELGAAHVAELKVPGVTADVADGAELGAAHVAELKVPGVTSDAAGAGVSIAAAGGGLKRSEHVVAGQVGWTVYSGPGARGIRAGKVVNGVLGQDGDGFWTIAESGDADGYVVEDADGF